MTNTAADDWSPADNPYAIAVSEARWWRDSALLTILRMRDQDDRRLSWFSSRQIDARHLIFALRQLLSAEQLEQFALKELGVDPAVRDVLTEARQRFVDALPGIKEMRDGLMHFEDWSRGMGRYGPQAARRKEGDLPRDLAREYWGFGYDPAKGTVAFGPYILDLDVADRAAKELCNAIYLAAHEVDRKNTVERRAKTVEALTAAGIAYSSPGAPLKVSPGSDLRIWLSLDLHADRTSYEELSAQIVAALSAAGLCLVSNMDPEGTDNAARLAGGETLYVEPAPQPPTSA